MESGRATFRIGERSLVVEGGNGVVSPPCGARFYEHRHGRAAPDGDPWRRPVHHRMVWQGGTRPKRPNAPTDAVAVPALPSARIPPGAIDGAGRARSHGWPPYRPCASTRGIASPTRARNDRGRALEPRLPQEITPAGIRRHEAASPRPTRHLPGIRGIATERRSAPLLLNRPVDSGIPKAAAARARQGASRRGERLRQPEFASGSQPPEKPLGQPGGAGARSAGLSGCAKISASLRRGWE